MANKKDGGFPLDTKAKQLNKIPDKQNLEPVAGVSAEGKEPSPPFGEEFVTYSFLHLIVRWLPIDTAPKDGTKILVCNKNYYEPETAYYGTYHPNAKGKEHWRVGSMRTKINPTHWMPLPKPPNT